MVNYKDNFMLREGTYLTAEAILTKLDEIARMAGMWSSDAFYNNIDSFRENVADFMVEVIKQNMHCSTLDGGSHYSMKGTFPKYPDAAGLSHIVWSIQKNPKPIGGWAALRDNLHPIDDPEEDEDSPEDNPSASDDSEDE